MFLPIKVAVTQDMFSMPKENRLCRHGQGILEAASNSDKVRKMIIKALETCGLLRQRSPCKIGCCNSLH